MNDSIIDGKNEFSGHIMKYENKRRNEGGEEEGEIGVSMCAY
jgi:hypothetical protein